MLPTFALQEMSAMECSLHELKLFLDRKVKERNLMLFGGVYSLPKTPGGCLLVSLVPMLEKKNDEKRYFSQAGQCAVLSLFRVRKMYFSGNRVGFQHSSDKNAVIRGKDANWNHC